MAIPIPQNVAISAYAGNPHSVTRMTLLFERQAGPLFRFLSRLTRGERDLVEDLLQETMLRAWRHRGSVPVDAESERRWLFTVARRIAIDAARARWVRPVEVVLIDTAATSPDPDPMDTAIATHSLTTAFAALSVAHQTVLRELYLRDASAEELAARLRVPVGTVKSRAHYALRSLRAAMNAVDPQ